MKKGLAPHHAVPVGNPGTVEIVGNVALTPASDFPYALATMPLRRWAELNGHRRHLVCYCCDSELSIFF
jgi:hypothetical protein